MEPYDFLGRGLKFPLQIDRKTGHIAMVSGEDDIKESIGIILNTYIGERVMRSDFGTDVASFVFEAANRGFLENVTVGLPERLMSQETRIEDVTVEVSSGNENNNGALLFSISYAVRSTNNRYNHVYPFYMDEGNQEEDII